MSRPDLSATALAELQIGSQQDHNARQERSAQKVRAQYEPLVSWPAFGFFFTLALAIASGFVLWWALGGKL